MLLALGAKYNGTTIDCQYSDITVFSFHPVKMITSAEGGMATTNCKDLNKYLRLAQSHGVTRDQNLFLSQADGPWYYEQISLGYNYRLSDLHAALGVSQMRKLDHFVNRRNQIAQFYNTTLNHSALKLPAEKKGYVSSFHLYVIELADTEISRLELFNFLKASGVGVNVHYRPIPLQPFYQEDPYEYFEVPNARAMYDRCISIPMHTKLTIDDAAFIAEKINSVL